MVHENPEPDLAAMPDEAGGEASPARRTIPRRTWIIVGASVLALVVIVVGALIVMNLLQEQAEAKAEAVSAYTSAQTSYGSALEGLRSALANAESLTGVTGDDEVDDVDLLVELRGEIDAAQESLTKTDVEYIDSAARSSEEVQAAAAELTSAQEQARGASKSLNDARVAVADDVSARTERLAEEQRAAKTAAAKAAAGPVGFEDLFRSGNNVIGTYYRFEGRIIQDAGSGSYRVNMTKDPGYSRVFWKDTILVSVAGTPGTRLLEDDIISFTAASGGVQSYTTVLGATVTLPLVVAQAGDISVTGRAD
ncbi:hypothetical protein [Clavibacter michiganensis]|uniref:hypothetical protein n=1 Tax=Clavibacter michiganensis TaxID=28447 RepID=UPI0013660E08|nr:hypothetical protein [Clavibacter michiganensis]MDO4045306.1 hypothetical protein [Clavibacter michiganensis]MDO4054404.1 hypothetical protein [Clavibacter michiganensis]MDO4057682.1 hypothetical protein [Clavibacter michiganensis]MDO4069698.1 hypothetical protein [Clavibacter michiganensis]MDO4076000.1 hypothetical protein [Clavibacter michiganensis]